MVNKETEKDFMDLEEVAAYLGVHIQTIYRYMKDEKNPLPSFQIMGKKTVRVKKSELDAWLENYRKDNK